MNTIGLDSNNTAMVCTSGASSITNRKVMNMFEDWERVVFRDDQTSKLFISEFLESEHGIMCVKDVTWNSCIIRVDYVLGSGQHITTNFSIQLWDEFYESNK